MTISKDDEREAREWLESWKHSRAATSAQNARTILALLDAPRLPRPEDVPESLIVRLAKEHGVDPFKTRSIIAYFCDHYTAPPQKVEAWAVYGTQNRIIATFIDKAEAEKFAAGCRRVVKLVEAADE